MNLGGQHQHHKLKLRIQTQLKLALLDSYVLVVIGQRRIRQRVSPPFEGMSKGKELKERSTRPKSHQAKRSPAQSHRQYYTPHGDKSYRCNRRNSWTANYLCSKTFNTDKLISTDVKKKKKEEKSAPRRLLSIFSNCIGESLNNLSLK